MKKLVIFDLDGTLIDTSYGLNYCMNFALTRLNLPTITTSQTKRFVGNGMAVYTKRALGSDNQDKFDECFDIFMQEYRTHGKDNCTVYDGIKELLASLERMQIKKAVLSNKADAATQTIISDFFANSFDYVLGNTDGEPLKPHPYGVKKILEHFAVLPEDAVILGDGETDIQCGKNSDIDVISALWGFRSKQTLMLSGAKVFAKSANDVLNLI